MEKAMRTRLGRQLMSFALVGTAVVGLGVTTARVEEFACTAFVDANYRGASWGLSANGQASRTHADNKISSFKIVRGCHVDAYEHVNFQGPSSKWTGDVPFVGPNWNDLISSWKCVCR
jgi:hypothetical protein